MYSREDATRALREIEWAEEKIVPIIEGPYRYRMVVHCSKMGKKRDFFANGEFPYFVHVECINQSKEWTAYGNSIIPVLPDGRLIMIVEQRSILVRFPDRSKTVEFSRGETFDLGEIGSLEFPGGAVEPGEKIKIGALRELQEESGLEKQGAILYRRVRPIYAFGSDIAVANIFSVVYLSGMRYENWTPTDGGLTVLALSETEVERNIRNGVIASGQAAMLAWGFYKEVRETQNNPELLKQYIDEGYISVEKVKIE